MGKSMMNNGICIQSFNDGGTSNDFYGLLDEIIEIEYPGLEMREKVVNTFQTEKYIIPTLRNPRGVVINMDANEIDNDVEEVEDEEEEEEEKEEEEDDDIMDEDDNDNEDFDC
ncbi:nucleoplasmin-like protein NO29 [Zingiber officinale]|uniref:nucleoplasmin-like protein NO29 n=1 Tax=Zingiber officinale TaxID=94328 RepID=UPI001C4D6205|nr:nucleoplasmin-like protein NO29 [Zingiber officinale]